MTLPFPFEQLPSPPRLYAGIGARATPIEVQHLMRRLGSHLARRGLILRSGGSPGADAAFESGCDAARGEKEIFLPWRGFNAHPSPFHAPPLQAESIAACYHPHWAACAPAARLLHARNVQQICGFNLDELVDFVLFWAPEKNGIVQGGTATAVHLARRMGIATFNLYDPQMLARFSGSHLNGLGDFI